MNRRTDLSGAESTVERAVDRRLPGRLGVGLAERCGEALVVMAASVIVAKSRLATVTSGK